MAARKAADEREMLLDELCAADRVDHASTPPIRRRLSRRS
jgi:hypothetical protein